MNIRGVVDAHYQPCINRGLPRYFGNRDTPLPYLVAKRISAGTHPTCPGCGAHPGVPDMRPQVEVDCGEQVICWACASLWRCPPLGLRLPPEWRRLPRG